VFSEEIQRMKEVHQNKVSGNKQKNASLISKLGEQIYFTYISEKSYSPKFIPYHQTQEGLEIKCMKFTENIKYFHHCYVS